MEQKYLSMYRDALISNIEYRVANGYLECRDGKLWFISTHDFITNKWEAVDGPI